MTAVAALAILALRSIGLLVYLQANVRGRTLGMIEAVLGLVFVVTVGLAWRI